jgi:very-short-patch-repair endonuclease
MQTTIQRAHARTMRKTMTSAETILWSRLQGRALQGFRFNRQVEIGPYIADFVCRDLKVIVEVDGATHSDATEVRYDFKRDAFLESKGYVVFRVGKNDVYQNLDGVLRGLLKVLENRTR